MCEDVADRLSFRRFYDIALGEPTPDDTTLFRFCTALGNRQLNRASPCLPIAVAIAVAWMGSPRATLAGRRAA